MRFEISSSLLGLIGFLFMVLSQLRIFLLNKNAKTSDKYKFAKWEEKPKEDGSPNFKIRKSKLDKKLFIPYLIFYIGVFLQVLSYLLVFLKN